jgi:hypothetical protein
VLKNIIVSTILFGHISLFSQIVFESEREHVVLPAKKPFQGYVKYEFYGDSRQSIGLGSNQYLLYPKPPRPDKNGKDGNSRGQLTQSAIETRLRYNFSTDSIVDFDWKINAVIEADFFGLFTPISEHAGVFRMRLAYAELSVPAMSFLVGQGWHPTYVLDCYPDVISFNGGAPFAPLARAPLAQFTFFHNTMQFTLAAISELNFTSDGPRGFTNDYSRNGIMPELIFRFEQKGKNHLFGFGYDLKRLAPRLVTHDDFVTHESILSNTGFVFYSFFHEHFVLSTQYTYAQNGTSVVLFGGYGVHSIDPETDKRDYANVATSNGWIDLTVHATKHIVPGIFFAYAYNHGSQKTILPDVVDESGQVIERRTYGLDPNVGQALRVAPRIRAKYESIVLGLEIELTAALFGTRDEFAKVHDGTWKLNGRILGTLFYFF